MKRSSPVTGFVGCALGLLVASLLPGGCSSDADPLDAVSSTGATSTSGAGGSGPTAGSAGRFPFGGRSGVNTGGQASAGDDGSIGGESSGAGEPAGGRPQSTVDRCSSDDDCRQVAGSCFVCESADGAKDCIDKGSPVCDDGVVEPCELCEIDQVKDCAELGEPGQFSGGSAYCSATCDGWDTSTCSVCGNGKTEPGEDCDGNTPPPTKTCSDIGLEQDQAALLPCAEQCRFDTTVCGGCSQDASPCLDGAACTAAACNGAQCKMGTTCQVGCAGSGKSCTDVRCNHDATCSFGCNSRGRCTGVVCDADATCTLNCTAGNCDGTVCKSGAACSFDCRGAGSCRDVACQPGAACNFQCVGAGSTCSGRAVCGPGQRCDFDCSDGGDCSELVVSCLSGSKCNFTCNGSDSVCPLADCQENATCVFDCADGDCNSPNCADDACSGG